MADLRKLVGRLEIVRWLFDLTRASSPCYSCNMYPACSFPWSRTCGHLSPRFSASGQCGKNESWLGQRRETDTCGASWRRVAASKHQGSGCTLGSFLRPFMPPTWHSSDRRGKWAGSAAGAVSKGATRKNRLVCGEFGWFRFLVVCFLYKTNPNPRKKKLLWEKVAQIPLLTFFFLGWVGPGLGSSSV